VTWRYKIVDSIAIADINNAILTFPPPIYTVNILSLTIYYLLSTTTTGEIEIEVQWTDRLYEYDLELAQQKQVMARRIQCMARKQSAKNAVTYNIKTKTQIYYDCSPYPISATVTAITTTTLLIAITTNPDPNPTLS